MDLVQLLYLVLELLAYALAIFAMTHVLVYKDGAFNSISWIRERSGGLLECVPCISFWFCLPLIILFNAVIAAAVWGVVILLDKIVSKLMV